MVLPAFGSAQPASTLAYLLFVIYPLSCSCNLRDFSCLANISCVLLFIQSNGTGWWAQVGVGEALLFALCQGRAAAGCCTASAGCCTASARPLPTGAEGHSAGELGRSIGLRTQLQRLEGQREASGKQRLSQGMRPGSRAAPSPAARAWRCGKQTLTSVLSSLTENIHFADTHTLGITGNRRLYIEVGTTLPSHPSAEGLPRTWAPRTFRAGGGEAPGSCLGLSGSPVERPLCGAASLGPKEGRTRVWELLRKGTGAFPLRLPPAGSKAAQQLFQRCPFPGPPQASLAAKLRLQSHFLTESCISVKGRAALLQVACFVVGLVACRVFLTLQNVWSSLLHPSTPPKKNYLEMHL